MDSPKCEATKAKTETSSLKAALFETNGKDLITDKDANFCFQHIPHTSPLKDNGSSNYCLSSIQPDDPSGSLHTLKCHIIQVHHLTKKGLFKRIKLLSRCTSGQFTPRYEKTNLASNTECGCNFNIGGHCTGKKVKSKNNAGCFCHSPVAPCWLKVNASVWPSLTLAANILWCRCQAFVLSWIPGQRIRNTMCVYVHGFSCVRVQLAGACAASAAGRTAPPSRSTLNSWSHHW